MGWLSGKQDRDGDSDGLYRGDAPASGPGLDGSQPSAYQRPPDLDPFARQFGQAVSYAQERPKIARKPVRLLLFGCLFLVLLIVGLVALALVVAPSENTYGGASSSSVAVPTAPAPAVTGVVGATVEMAVGDNSYRITIADAVAEPSDVWGSYSRPSSGGYLVIGLTVTRTDSAPNADQIAWYDWHFAATEAAADLSGALIAGGYDPLLSTINLKPGESVTGLIAFDTPASVGSLSLTTFNGNWARWPIIATTPRVISGELGAPAKPEVGRTPVTVTVSDPRWILPGDPAVSIDPSSGSYLLLNVRVQVDESALASNSAITVGEQNWRFTPVGGAPADHAIGLAGTSGATFAAGQPTSVDTSIAFDAARGAGTLDWVNSGGSLLATWQIPAP